jgi:hypothetical protein
MKNFKKVVALGMSVAMMAGSYMPALAGSPGDSGEAVTGGGAGEEAFVDKEVYQIVVPTGDALTKAFDFKVDPTGLVAETEGKEFGSGVTVEGKGIYFKNKEGGTTKKVSNLSDPMTIVNKSAIGVTIAVSTKMKAGSGAAAAYAGGYSSTPDFGHSLEAGTQKTADAAAGLYIGIIASNENIKPINGTAVTFTNVIESAYDKYEVGYSGSAYTFSLPSSVKPEDCPSYQFYAYGQLNADAAESVWVDTSGSTKVAKTMPEIELVFTPTKITGTIKANMLKDDASRSVYVYKTTVAEDYSDGGFEAKPTAIKVNGKTVTAGEIADNYAGYVVITWDNIAKAWGYSDPTKMTDEEIATVWAGVKTVEVTSSSINYYAE